MRRYRVEVCGQRMPINRAHIRVTIFGPIETRAYHPTCDASANVFDGEKKLVAQAIKFAGIYTLWLCRCVPYSEKVRIYLRSFAMQNYGTATQLQNTENMQNGFTFAIDTQENTVEFIGPTMHQ